MNQANKPVRRLHIGGIERREGWEIFDALPREGVNHRGDAADLSRFPDGTFAELYASHVLEHFDFREAVPRVLKEWHRVLQPGGRLCVSVPDMERLCHLYLTPGLYPEARLKIMWMMFGAHADAYDYHYAGFNADYLGSPSVKLASPISSVCSTSACSRTPAPWSSWACRSPST